MAGKSLSPRERERVLELARQGLLIKVISERLSMPYDRLRRIVERAEQAGEVPPGTLAACTPGANRKKKEPPPPPPQPVPGITVMAPTRAVAAKKYGYCSASDCTAVAAVVVIDDRSGCGCMLRLCLSHAALFNNQVDKALSQQVRQGNANQVHSLRVMGSL